MFTYWVYVVCRYLVKYIMHKTYEGTYSCPHCGQLNLLSIPHINEQLLYTSKLPKHTHHQTRRVWGGKRWDRSKMTATAMITQDFRKYFHSLWALSLLSTELVPNQQNLKNKPIPRSCLPLWMFKPWSHHHARDGPRPHRRKQLLHVSWFLLFKWMTSHGCRPTWTSPSTCNLSL